MSVALLVTEFEPSVGAVLKAKAPRDFADEYHGGLMAEIMRVFAFHAMGEALDESAVFSARIGGREYYLASYYTTPNGTGPYCIMLLVEPSEDPRTYLSALRSVAPRLVDAVCSLSTSEMHDEVERAYQDIVAQA